jgi:hypothetical protein
MPARKDDQEEVEGDAVLRRATPRLPWRGRVGASQVVRSRKVVVKKLRPGPDQTVGRDRTNRKGRWRVPRKHAHGRFYAKAKRKSFVARNGDKVVCRAKRTRRIQVS